MLIFICTGCGRFGGLPAPEDPSASACPHCGNKDYDWVSRPDIDDPKMNIDPMEGQLGVVEKVVLSVMERVYAVYCDADIDEKNKKKYLQDTEKYLSPLLKSASKSPRKK